MRRLAILSALVLLPLITLAQEQDCSRSVVISVENKNGEPISAMPAEVFRVKYGREYLSVRSAESAKLRRVAILLDTSGSMDLKREAVQEAIAGVLRAAPGSVQFALLAFGDDIHVLSRSTNDKDQVWQAWQALPVSDAKTAKARAKQKKDTGFAPPMFGVGRTRLRDALLAAMDLLGDATDEDAIFLITDGGDNRSDAQEKLLKQRLIASRTRLMVLLLSDPNPATIEEIQGPATLRSFANLGGGVVSMPPHSEAGATAEYLMRILGSGIRLSLESASPAEKVRRLKVQFERDAPVKGYRVNYPERLRPCGSLASGTAATPLP